MNMVKIVYEVQEDAAKYIDTSTKGLALLLYPQIKNGTLSCGKVAELLGINKYDLFDWYSDLGFSYFDITTEDVQEDMRTLEKILGSERRGCL